jgi:23S rRNA (cytosine1962-C5)-methyltransferase
MEQKDLITTGWADYELLDSGNGRKLERFGSVITDRPDTQAIWSPARDEVWSTATAKFTQEGKDNKWEFKGEVPEKWILNFHGLIFGLRFGNFKHLGVFPEHAVQWNWLEEKVKALGTANVLNLFGYTGAASLAARVAGAEVTHVDSSKQSVEWASENAKLSDIEEGIRWIVDDAAAFVKREVKRGAKYEGIVLDPPAFGRGAKGQVWHIEEDLLPLLRDLKEILSPKPGSFLLLSGYAAGFAPRSFAQAVESVFDQNVEITFGNLDLQESNSDRVIPTGIYVRLILT